MKFTMDIPVGVITAGEFQTAEAVKSMANALENAGVDACYVTDHPAPSAEWLHANGHDAIDPFVALSTVAAHTTKLMLHTNILVMAYRNPFLTAKAAASLQVLSGGRFILGAGAGYQTVEFAALGVDFHKRGKLFDEAIDTIHMAWNGGVVVKEGMGFNAIGNEPRPVPQIKPPIWIGGGSPAAVKRAALRGDGWSPFFAAPTMTALCNSWPKTSSKHRKCAPKLAAQDHLMWLSAHAPNLTINHAKPPTNISNLFMNWPPSASLG